jgi:hypothetical protein
VTGGGKKKSPMEAQGIRTLRGDRDGRLPQLAKGRRRQARSLAQNAPQVALIAESGRNGDFGPRDARAKAGKSDERKTATDHVLLHGKLLCHIAAL